MSKYIKLFFITTIVAIFLITLGCKSIPWFGDDTPDSEKPEQDEPKQDSKTEPAPIPTHPTNNNDDEQLRALIIKLSGQVENLNKKTMEQDEEIKKQKEEIKKLKNILYKRDMPDDNSKNDTILQELKEKTFTQNSPEVLFNQAKEHEKNNDFYNALILYGKISAKFHKHKLAEQAMFNSGEIYLKQKEYRLSIDEFNKIIKIFPNSKMLPQVFLKSALGYKALKQEDAAKKYLNIVVEKFPASGEAALAKKELENL